MTVEELYLLPDDGRRYELLDGELKEMAPAGYEHGLVVLAVGAELRSFVRANDPGEVLAGDPGIVLRRGPDRVRAPDVAFFAKGRAPKGPARKKFAEVT